VCTFSSAVIGASNGRREILRSISARSLPQERLRKGKVAVVILDANPIENINNTQKINAVVVNGRLLERPALDDMLAQVEAIANQKTKAQPVSGLCPKLCPVSAKIRNKTSQSAAVAEKHASAESHASRGL